MLWGTLALLGGQGNYFCGFTMVMTGIVKGYNMLPDPRVPQSVGMLSLSGLEFRAHRAGVLP